MLVSRHVPPMGIPIVNSLAQNVNETSRCLTTGISTHRASGYKQLTLRNHGVFSPSLPALSKCQAFAQFVASHGHSSRAPR